MACAKCKQGVPFDGDTWCLACISWEQIEIELNSPWHSKGVRDLGTEVVVTAAKQTAGSEEPLVEPSQLR